MTVTVDETDVFLQDTYASGPITGFGDEPLAICYFNYTLTYYASPFTGQSVTTTPLSLTIPSARVYPGIMTLPGGAIYSPWSLAKNRAPTSFPVWTQRILYKGHARAVQQELRKLLGLVGVTSVLRFANGRVKADGSVTPKDCLAMLLPINGTMERVITHASPSPFTWLEVTASWQQTGKFYN